MRRGHEEFRAVVLASFVEHYNWDCSHGVCGVAPECVSSEWETPWLTTVCGEHPGKGRVFA